VLSSSVGRWCDDAPAWDDAVFISTAANDEDGVPLQAGDVEIKFRRPYAVDGGERRRSLSPMLFYGVRRRCDDAPNRDDAVGTLTAVNDEDGVPSHAKDGEFKFGRPYAVDGGEWLRSLSPVLLLGVGKWCDDAPV